jgi:hypothetical protein
MPAWRASRSPEPDHKRIVGEVAERHDRPVDFMVATRRALARQGPGSLVVDDLTVDDLERIDWSGSARHVQAVAEVLMSVERGKAEYLAVRSPDGSPVAIGGIDYAEALGVGMILPACDPSPVAGPRTGYGADSCGRGPNPPTRGEVRPSQRRGQQPASPCAL